MTPVRCHRTEPAGEESRDSRTIATNDEIPRALGMTLVPCDSTQHLDEWLEVGKDGEGGKDDELDELFGYWADANLCRQPRLSGDAPAIKPGPE
jgi:hypothetical protein